MLPRAELLKGLERDLLGPQGSDHELIDANPSDQYISGILYHRPNEPDSEDDQDDDGAEADDGSPGEAVSMAAMRRPNMMGISFAIRGETPSVRLRAAGGRYCKVLLGPDEQERPFEDGASVPEGGRVGWRRTPVDLAAELAVPITLEKYLAEGRTDGLCWWIRGLKMEDDGAWQVTVVLTNEAAPEPGRQNREEALVFQAGFTVEPGPGCELRPRFSRQARTDDDAMSNAVIYRNAREWAVGHTCAATWVEDEDGRVHALQATWVPTQIVPAMNANGHHCFPARSEEVTGDPTASFEAERLASAPDAEALCRLLRVVPDAYSGWLDDQEARLPGLAKRGELDDDLGRHAMLHIERGREVVARMRAGIDLLEEDSTARNAFQLAQRAMVLQRKWGESDPKRQALIWRPFQLGFQLLSLAGIAAPVDGSGEATPDRRTMDLLWFPTGGGKTEAYLGLSAFTVLHRRLRQERSPDDGAGVAILMRYTLRLLTVQQFERAARLMVACDHLRRTLPDGPSLLGNTPFGIGLWVGSGATPNKLRDLTPEDEARIKQLARCPACRKPSLQWDTRPGHYQVRCKEAGCDLKGLPLPIYTVDTTIYENRPSLVIGTVDKFAQIVRNPSTRNLLGSPPPDLIIQDELHLISGPLGTMVGLYEAAVDRICSRNGVPPKVVGSTATIRRADDQVLKLFNRRVMQFPPPILDAEDSCFAIVDDEAPGRLYAGVTTAGRSPKFMLQAVCATLMQWAHELHLPDKERDPYWTLVAYFNSLRELGGALVMMQDDVEDSISTYATLHKAERRPGEDPPLELTSRVDSAEIPHRLVELEKRYPDQPIGSVLATNMISVGVDIPRLGLMVVNGQPKGMAEYIQATSRVGRGNVAGLVVTVYNAGRPRDRSHYEAFRTWHQTLYREVEATSVTPFAPRARDRALHAVVVALARHLVAGMANDPLLDEDRRRAVERLVDDLVARATEADLEEASGVAEDAARFLDRWERRADLEHFWHFKKHKTSLLASLEDVATAKALGGWRHSAIGTPNSMRNVEAETKFKLWEAPMSRKEQDG